MYMCVIVTSQGLQCRRQMNSSNFTHCACRLCMHSDPPITLVLIVLKQTTPLHMGWVAREKVRENPQKEKQCQLSGIILATRRMILTKHVFCVDSTLHLLPQWEVTQLTIYVSTTQPSTTNRGKISAVYLSTRKQQCSIKCYSGHLVVIYLYFCYLSTLFTIK